MPRGGKLVRVRVTDRSELRALRTELELLRRVRRIWCATLGSQLESQPTHAPAATYTTQDRRDLACIIRDAAHPIVEETIGLLDEEFSGLRKELVMAVVNEEAENIVQEAVESGAVESGAIAPEEAASKPTKEAPLPPDIESALVEAEAELAVAVAGAMESPSQEQADPEPSSDSVVFDEAAAAAADMAAVVAAEALTDSADDGLAEATGGQTADDLVVEEAAASDAPEEADVATEMPETVDAAEAAQFDIPAEPVEPVMDAEPCESTSMEVDATETVAAEPVADAVPTVDAEVSEPVAEFPFDNVNTEPVTAGSTMNAEQAVLDIERGIHKLAGILSAEVGEQWRQARSAYDDVASTRVALEETRAKAKAMLEDIARMAEETAIARDDANVARREARLMREDARKAKERADASAAAAEHAADQANREAQSVAT